MSNIDKNRIFFGLLHYIFTEQPNVNWAFKTSLVNFTGLNETMNQKKYKNDSISNDIIKYVKEVKPYHVQFNHYIEKYSSKTDECNIKPSDSLFPTIKVRYDNVAVKPNINYIVYDAGYELPNPNDIKSSREIRFLNLQENSIYMLKYNNEEPYWEYEASITEDDLIFVEKLDILGKVKQVLDENYIEINKIIELSYDELIEYENESAANRIFLYKTHDLELLKEYVNGNFKGLHIDGSDFNIDRFGYDAFLYDLKRYEEPVKTIAYCLIDKDFTQIPVGENTFSINSDEELTSENIKIKSEINGITKIIDDFSLDKLNNTYVITLFTTTQLNEKITISKSNNTIIEKYITNTFSESDDEGFIRKFINYDSNIIKTFTDITTQSEFTKNCYELDLPTSTINYNKIAVSLEKPNGYRRPIYEFQDYIIENNKIYIFNEIFPTDKINWKIFISVTDMSLLYDKIYTWEDVYGISNNKTTWEEYYQNNGLIQNLNGNDFLNPHYEKERPDELSVIYPQNTLMLYFSKKYNENEYPDSNNSLYSNIKSLFSIDFKNTQNQIKSLKSALLLEDFKAGDSEIKINKDIFKKPYMENDKLMPGKILINSELIEFYDYELINENNNNKIILKKIRRGTNGTFIKNIHKKDSIVFSYGNPKEIPLELINSYYFINNINMTKFTINGYFNNKNKINVFKTNNIKLISDITKESNSFLISDDSIIKPIYDENNNLLKEGYLYINDTKIIFNEIKKDTTSDNYIISGFNNILGKEFYANDNPYIPSNKFVEINDDEYTINTEEYENYEDGKAKEHNYIILNENPKIGECIIIENHSKDIFN